MKVKIIGPFQYITTPELPDMIEVPEQDLQQLYKTKQFDIENNCVIPFNKEQYLLEQQKQARIEEIKPRLNQLSEDIIQYQAGENVPDITKRKAEFIQLHNELRQLEGKEPRGIR